MSVNIFFHTDPVTVDVLPNPTGGFIRVVCGEVSIYVGGQGDVCAARAVELAEGLTKAALKLALQSTTVPVEVA